jgi:Phage terminase large subunit (GpA)
MRLEEVISPRRTRPPTEAALSGQAHVYAGDGDHADLVLNFCGPRLGRRVFAGKGMSGTRPGFQMSRAKKAKTSRLAIIGVDVLKSAIFDRLARGSAIRFSNSLEPVYFEQLASERRVVRYKREQPSRRFEPRPRQARGGTGCVGLRHRCRQAVQINFDQRAAELAAAPMPALPSVISRSG